MGYLLFPLLWTVVPSLLNLISSAVSHGRGSGSGLLIHQGAFIPRGGRSDVDRTATWSEASDDVDEATRIVASKEPTGGSTNSSDPSLLDGRFALISVLAVASNSSDSRSAADRSSCMLVSANESEPIQVWEGSDQSSDSASSTALWQSCALLSDVLIVILHGRPVLPPNLQASLATGLEQRARAGLSRGRLLVMGMTAPTSTRNATSLNKANQWTWRERLVLGEMQSLSPILLERLDVNLVSTRDVHWYDSSVFDYNVMDVMEQRNGLHSLVDAASVVPLLETLHHHFGGRTRTNRTLLQAHTWSATELLQAIKLDEERRELFPPLAQSLGDASSKVAIDGAEQVVPLHRNVNNVDDPLPLNEQSRSDTAMPSNGLGNRTHFTNASDLNQRSNHATKTPVQSGWSIPSFLSRLRVGRRRSRAAKAPVDPLILQEMDMRAFQNLIELVDLLETALKTEGDGPSPFPMPDVANHIEHLVLAVASIHTTHLQVAAKERALDWYRQYLESMRNHFGKLFETALDGTDDPKSWQALRLRIVNHFEKSVQSSIPHEFVAHYPNVWQISDFSYISALQGLESDMDFAVDLRRELFSSDDVLLGEIDSPSQARRKRFIKWSKKVAAKGLMLGINYLQGWLAWQGIKRAALERERKLPKFPLF